MNDEDTRPLILRGCYGKGHSLSQGNTIHSTKIKWVGK